MPGAIEQEILTQEENLTQAKRQLDTNAFDRIYADDVMFTGVTGEVSGKAALMTEAARGMTERDNAGAQEKKCGRSSPIPNHQRVAETREPVADYRWTNGKSRSTGSTLIACAIS